MDAANDNQCGPMRGGLTFLKTRDRTALVDFYQNKLGMKVWLEQPNITVLSFGNLLLGWHQIVDDESTTPEVAGCYTFVYPSKKEVDDIYQVFFSHDTTQSTLDGPPRVNERYQIYQFFAKDPEGSNARISSLSSSPLGRLFSSHNNIDKHETTLDVNDKPLSL